MLFTDMDWAYFTAIKMIVSKITRLSKGDIIMAEKKEERLKIKRAKVSGYNKPKRTPGHAKKSHIVVAKVAG